MFLKPFASLVTRSLGIGGFICTTASDVAGPERFIVYDKVYATWPKVMPVKVAVEAREVWEPLDHPPTQKIEILQDSKQFTVHGVSFRVQNRRTKGHFGAQMFFQN